MGKINLVLYEPEIPQNTGNIMRTCVATNTVLHLIEPLGFSLGEKEIKRSGANYIKDVEYILYKNYDEFIEKNKGKGKMYYLSRYGVHSIHDLDVSNTDEDYYVSNVAAIIVYEALRQQGFPGLCEFEPEKFKGKNYLSED